MFRHESARYIAILAIVLALGIGYTAYAQEEQASLVGGVLTVATDRIPTNLYPGKSTALVDIALNMLIYDALVITDDNGEIRPLLAKSWDVSEDGLTWVFHLRDDVVFHSGRKFTAADVKFHFDQWQKDFPTRAKIAALESTEIIDDYTVQFNLHYPTLVFLMMISQTEWGYGGIPDSEAVKQWGDDYGIIPESISGTGPYKVVEWVRDQYTRLARFEEYTWGPDMYDNVGPAYLDEILYRSIPEDATRSAALELGQIDMDLVLSPLVAERLAASPGISVLTQSKVSANHIGFNHDDPLFQDVLVRRAFVHAINQQDIVDFVWMGFAEQTCGFWHPAIDGSTPCSEMQPHVLDYDPERAKALLDAAGWVPGPGGIRVKDGQPLRITMDVYLEVQEQIAIIVQAHLREVGIDLRIRSMEYAAREDLVARGEHQLYYLDGTHSTADFSYWFTSEALPTPNRARWVNEQTDEWYNISQRTLDPFERTAAFQAIERQFVEEAVIIPMPHHSWIIGMRDRVGGATLHSIHGLYKMLDIYVGR